VPGATPATQPLLARLIDHAIAYYRDFVRPEKRYRAPDAMEREALEDLAASLATVPQPTAEAIQTVVFEVGKRHPFKDLRAWFGCLYQVLLGQREGPRFGGFVALYGIPETIALIRSALSLRPGPAPGPIGAPTPAVAENPAPAATSAPAVGAAADADAA